MKREDLLLKYAETSVQIYGKLLDKILKTSPIVGFENGTSVFSFPAEPVLPMNGIYVMLDKRSDPVRIVRVGTHEVTSPNGLLSRVFNHMVSSKNRSILRKHIGSALLADNPKKLAKWLVKKEKGDAATELAVTKYMEEHIEVGFLPVNDLKVLEDAEKYLISVVALATVTDPELIAARSDWLGNRCDEATVAEYGVWNDDHVKWHPKDEAELKKLVRTVKYLGIEL